MIHFSLCFCSYCHLQPVKVFLFGFLQHWESGPNYFQPHSAHLPLSAPEDVLLPCVTGHAQSVSLEELYHGMLRQAGRIEEWQGLQTASSAGLPAQKRTLCENFLKAMSLLPRNKYPQNSASNFQEFRGPVRVLYACVLTGPTSPKLVFFCVWTLGQWGKWHACGLRSRLSWVWNPSLSYSILFLLSGPCPDCFKLSCWNMMIY